VFVIVQVTCVDIKKLYLIKLIILTSLLTYSFTLKKNWKIHLGTLWSAFRTN